ncbi:FCRLA protein, partial [Sapayoa aenigma]|nr:FCRLA protein [Sapayoa aenigma]
AMGHLCPADWLVLQVPAHALMEGDKVALRCRGWNDMPVTQVRFYQEGKDLGEPLEGTELSLPTLQLHHRGRYRCRGRVSTWLSQWSEESVPVTVTVHGERLHTDT